MIFSKKNLVYTSLKQFKKTPSNNFLPTKIEFQIYSLFVYE
jgi:hypothetical protein